jgi:hypothetical protein
MEKRINEFKVWNCVTKQMFYPDWNELAIRAMLCEMILLQHFGYFDKYGTKIFEGDILQCGKAKCVVKFVDGAFAFCNGIDWLYEWNWADDARRFKVIGNIFENHELFDYNY